MCFVLELNFSLRYPRIKSAVKICMRKYNIFQVDPLSISPLLQFNISKLINDAKGSKYFYLFLYILSYIYTKWEFFLEKNYDSEMIINLFMMGKRWITKSSNLKWLQIKIIY